jgi:ABC-type nitrate/sulfonate/bicarbonate transport system ATPase subunit
MSLVVTELTKTYSAKRGELLALAPTTFEVEAGEFVTLLGPSGCGKSTALRLIAGLETPSDGRIVLDGAEVTGPSPERGMVFQSYTLYPWLSVWENTCFGTQLKENRSGRAGTTAEQLERARSLLELMGLADFHGAHPRELSGGMKQRVAIARALTNRPKVLLMDEPFGALDAQTREAMQALMLVLHAHERASVLFVTHDVEEAIYLSSRVLVFSPRPGRVVREVTVPFGPSTTREPDLKLTPEFTQHKRELLELLHDGARSHGAHRSALEKLVKPATEGPPP